MIPCGAMIWWIGVVTLSGWHATAIDSASTLECHRRLYTYRATQTDSQGFTCWDTISVMSCWGRCDSNEISDWRFPYKRSYHPVCVHGKRAPKFQLLRFCEPPFAPVSARRYEYLEAVSCQCQQCSSSDTSCEGLRYRGERSEAFTALDSDDENHFEDNYDTNFIE